MGKKDSFDTDTLRMLAAARQGEFRGFGEIVSGQMPRLLVRARSILGSDDEAQDAVQEALLVAFTRFQQLRNPERFQAWLRAIVDSQCYRLIRKRGREVPLERIEPLVSNVPDPAESYEQACLKGAVDQAVSGLSPPLRVVCHLYYQQGYSTTEIAHRLNLKKGTVRKRLHSALPALGASLSEQLGTTAIRVGYLPISDHLLGMVAHRLTQGRHSRIRMQRFLSWKALSDSLAHNQIDAAFIMAPLVMHLYNTGTKLRYILDGHHDGSALAASNTALQGKLVGVPGHYSTHHVLLSEMAREFPYLLEDVNTAEINPSYAIRSLKRRAIHAFFCGEPWGTKSVHEGDAQVLIHSKDVFPGHACCVVAVHDAFCRKHGEVVDAYVRALRLARDKLHRDPWYGAETQAMYTGVRKELALQVLEEKIITFEDLAPDRGRMTHFMKLAQANLHEFSSCDLDGFLCTEFC